MIDTTKEAIIIHNGKRLKVKIGTKIEEKPINGITIVTGTLNYDEMTTRKQGDGKAKIIYAGGGGAYIISPAQGNDKYIWGEGHGNFTVDEVQTKGDHDDSIEIVGDLKPDDIDFYMANDENGERNLYVKIKETGETFTVLREKNPEAMAKIHFNPLDPKEKDITIQFMKDGIEYRAKTTPIEPNSTKGDTLKGTSFLTTFIGSDYDDTIYGYWPCKMCIHAVKPHTYIGNKGNDTIFGDLGDNIFIWEPGHGNDTYSDVLNGANKIKSVIKMPLTAKAGLLCYLTNTPDNKEVVVIWHKPTNEYITIDRQDNPNAISAIKFSGSNQKIDLINNIKQIFDAYPPTEEVYNEYFGINTLVHEEL